MDTVYIYTSGAKFWLHQYTLGSVKAVTNASKGYAKWENGNSYIHLEV